MIVDVIAVVLALVVDPGGSCNNTNDTVVSPPGKQPGTVQNQGCAQGDIVLSVTVNAEGDIVVAGAGVEETVAVTLTSPASCVSSYVWHSAEIHECGSELLDFNCNPKQHIVRVKYFESDDPCPDTTDLLALVKTYAANVLAGNPFSIPLSCKVLPDATATLDPVAKKRNSAGIVKCGVDPAGPPPNPYPAPTWQEFGTHVYVDVMQRPGQVDIESFIPPGVLVDGVFGVQLEGSIDLPSPVLPDVLDAVRLSHAPFPSANDLECAVEQIVWLPDEELGVVAHRDVTHISGDFWVDGRFSLDRYLSVLSVDDHGHDELVQFAESWTRDGSVYHAQSGLESGTVYPAKNGAASFIAASELVDGEFLSRWVSDPFALEHLIGTPFVELDELDGQRVFRRALPDGQLEVLVDDGGSIPRLVEQRKFVGASLRERTSFGRYVEVASGVWRPMLIRVDVLDASGQLQRTKEYALAGRPAVLVGEPTLEYPQPTLDRWSIWVR